MDWSEMKSEALREFESLRKKVREELPRAVELRADIDEGRLSVKETGEVLAQEVALRKEGETRARDAELHYAGLIRKLQDELRCLREEQALFSAAQEADIRSRVAVFTAAWEKEKAVLHDEIEQLKGKNNEFRLRFLAAERSEEQAKNDGQRTAELLARESERRCQLESRERELEARYEAKLKELTEQARGREQDLEAQAASRQALLEQAWRKETAAMLNELALWRQNAQERLIKELDLERRAAQSAEEIERLAAAHGREIERRAELEKAANQIEASGREHMAVLEAAWENEKEMLRESARRLEELAQKRIEKIAALERDLAQARELAARQAARAESAEAALQEGKAPWEAERAKLEERLARLAQLAQARLEENARLSLTADAARETARRDLEELFKKQIEEERLAREADLSRLEELSRARLEKIASLENALGQASERAALQATRSELAEKALQEGQAAWQAERDELMERLERFARVDQVRLEELSRLRLAASEAREAGRREQEERSRIHFEGERRLAESDRLALEASVKRLEELARERLDKIAGYEEETRRRERAAAEEGAAERKALQEELARLQAASQETAAADVRRQELIAELKGELERWKDVLAQKESLWTRSMANLERSHASEIERLSAEAQRAESQAADRLAEVVALRGRLQENEERLLRAEDAAKTVVEQAHRLQVFKENLEEQYQARVQSLKAEELSLRHRQEEYAAAERERQELWEKRIADAEHSSQAASRMAASSEELARKEAALEEKAKALDERAARGQAEIAQLKKALENEILRLAGQKPA